jgi:phospholipid/cholesterol/gamma-HCH transport system permease protein
MPAEPSTATAEITGVGDSMRVKLTGRLDADSAAGLWQELASKKLPDKVVVDGKDITYCDSAGVALLCHLRQTVNANLQNLPADTQQYLDSVDIAKIPDFRPEPKKQESAPVSVGRITCAFFTDIREMTVFTGQATVALVRSLMFPASIRWGEFWVTFEKAGVNALLIVGLIGFLTGMIMAFQSTVPLRQFGVDIYVVNLVGLSMLRELGVIMTAIVFAGRTGSAFAAEIGTMKVNEEVNALTTMGLDPVRFLVTPKMLAGIIVMPLLTIYTNVAGVAGGLFVVILFGHPWAAVWNQLVASVGYHDVLAGLMKAVVFGFLISGVGCLRGLQTKSGASAVGDSTTSAVVTSIFLIVVVDAIFAVVFYATGF